MVNQEEKVDLSGRKRMDQENRNKLDPKAQEDRRAFLRRAGKAGIGIPATALLLSVTDKKANAWGWGYGDNGDYMERIYSYIQKYKSSWDD
jgi:hypothetical protein